MNVSIKAEQSSSTDIHNTAVLAEQTSQIYAAVNNALIATIINASVLVFVLVYIEVHLQLIELRCYVLDLFW